MLDLCRTAVLAALPCFCQDTAEKNLQSEAEISEALQARFSKLKDVTMKKKKENGLRKYAIKIPECSPISVSEKETCQGWCCFFTVAWFAPELELPKDLARKPDATMEAVCQIAEKRDQELSHLNKHKSEQLKELMDVYGLKYNSTVRKPSMVAQIVRQRCAAPRLLSYRHILYCTVYCMYCILYCTCFLFLLKAASSVP